MDKVLFIDLISFMDFYTNFFLPARKKILFPKCVSPSKKNRKWWKCQFSRRLFICINLILNLITTSRFSSAASASVVDGSVVGDKRKENNLNFNSLSLIETFCRC